MDEELRPGGVVEAGMDPSKIPVLHMEEPERDTESFTIFDERAQKVFDAQAIEAFTTEIRKLLANAKINRMLAQHGLLQADHDLHPEKFKTAIAQHRQALEILKQLGASLGDEGLSEGQLETYNQMPTVVDETILIP